MKSNIKFVLAQGWGDYKILWLMKYELNKSYNGFLKNGNVEWEEVKEGSRSNVSGKELTPFMKIPYMFDIQMLVDALTDTKKATEQVETLSELKATRFHLEDMRRLVFKDEIFYNVNNDTKDR